MLFLNVPFHQKDEAKALGAKWNAQAKKWYIPDGLNIEEFGKWLLLIELVPETAWYKNLRSELTKEEWENVKRKTFMAANYTCEICGGKGPNHPVECHEVWKYDIETGVQTLIRTIALCPACHEVKHFGRANIKGRFKVAMAHLMKVNNWDEDTGNWHFDKCGEEWLQRNEIDWVLDARWLLDFINLSEETKQTILDHAEGLYLLGENSDSYSAADRWALLTGD